MLTISTKRLKLYALSQSQLATYLENPAALESSLGFAVSTDVFSPVLRRAISIKLEKMAKADPGLHPWYTYWMIETPDPPFGAGTAGFKGTPDQHGVVEIGYGIDPAVRSMGYMTEAVIALIDWAFQDPACKTVIAPGTRRDNRASNRVLEKAGMTVYAEDAESLSWKIERRN